METGTQEPITTEQVDAVVVGSRIAGCATAIALARAGRRVIALDRAKFPSDTLSTHFLFATGVAELHRLGALERVLEASRAPKYQQINLSGEGLETTGPMAPYEGFDYGICPRRITLDMALVETAREAGAEIREGCDVRSLVWAGGRAAGVRYRDADGTLREIRAKLVVGADGRRSATARMLGVGEPYRTSENGRGLAFKYVKDPRTGADRHVVHRWHFGQTVGLYFPSDGDEGLALFMGPKEQIARFRRDPDREWREHVDANPRMRERLEGCEDVSKLRSAADTFAFFRISSGKGWALAGDAGHFKDPVVAQGIRDGLRFGRLLGEAAAPAIDDPDALDAALRAYEHERDRQCIPSFYLGRQETRVHPINAIEESFYREVTSDADACAAFLQVLGRVDDPRDFFTPQRLGRYVGAALQRGADRHALRHAFVDELKLSLSLRRDMALAARDRRIGAGAWGRWGAGGWSDGISMPRFGPPPEPKPRRRARAAAPKARAEDDGTTVAATAREEVAA